MSTQVIVAGPRNGITVKKIEEEVFKKPLEVVKSGKSYKGQKNIVIEGLDFRQLNEAGGKQCAVSDCQNITIRRCIFGNKNTLGVALNITGANTKKVTVEYCIFEKMTYTESNGGEPCRLGNSQFSGCVLESTVKNCIFRDLKSDPEAISVKSCNNIIEDNFFIGNNANVTVRHGGFTTIRHNYFAKSGGIRLHGYGNKVLYNAFEDFGDNEQWAPIIVRYGNQEKDPNFTAPDKPSGKAGSSHAIYARTINNEIEGNEFKNCKKTILETPKGASLKPTGTKTGKNPTVQAFKFGSSPTTPQKPQEPEIEVTPVEPQKPTPLPTTTGGDKADTDKYGIKKIYADATDRPLHQYQDMNNPKAGRIDNYPGTYKVSTEAVPGGFKATETGGTGRVALFSDNGNPFGSVEHTVYFKFINGPTGGSERIMQPYIGGGSHHTDKTRCCEGNAYKIGIHADGNIKFRKEICHAAYAGDRSGNPSGSIKALKNGGLLNRWYGFKQIELQLADRNRMEVWLDEGADDGNGGLKIAGNENRWKLVAANEDRVTGTNQGRPIGNWTSGSFDSSCTGCVAESRSDKPLVNGLVRLEPYVVTHPGGHDIPLNKANACVLRLDGDKTVRIAYWSGRKILTRKNESGTTAPIPEVVVPNNPSIPEEPVVPDTEQPVVTPTNDNTEDTHMCGIYRHEEAKAHLHIYACGEHADLLRQKFKQILREVEEETRKAGNSS